MLSKRAVFLTDDYQRMRNSLRFFNAMKHSGCQLNVLWLAWSVLQIFAVNLTFYGMKNTNWKLFLPHMIFRWVESSSNNEFFALKSLHEFYSTQKSQFLRLNIFRRLHGINYCFVSILLWRNAEEFSLLYVLKKQEDTVDYRLPS